MVDKFVKAFNNLLWNCPGRKGRFLMHLKNALGVDSPKMVPNPIGTRWNCWYDAVKYHKNHLCVYWLFIENEALHCVGQIPESLTTLTELLQRDAIRSLKADIDFIISKSAVFIEMTDFFQSRKPLAIKVCDSLEEMEFLYSFNGVSQANAEEFFEPSMTTVEREECRVRFSDAYVNVHNKLRKYMTTNGRPAIKFLEEVRFFNPKAISRCPNEQSAFAHIPEFASVPEHEFLFYKDKLGPQAAKHSVGEIDIHYFWKSNTEQLPTLSRIALRYAFATCNSADVECSFSLYNNLFTKQRQRLTEENVKASMFLFYNKLSSLAVTE